MKSVNDLVGMLRLRTACTTALALGSCAVQSLHANEAVHPLAPSSFQAAPAPTDTYLPQQGGWVAMVSQKEPS